MNDQSNQTASYVELWTNGYNLLVDAYAQANHRALQYGRSLYEIVSRPYASTALENACRENYDRLNQIVDLTVRELQANGQQAAEFGRNVVAQNARWQETFMQTARGLLQTGVSNLNYVKDATDQQFNGFAKRVDEMTARVERAAGRG